MHEKKTIASTPLLIYLFKFPFSNKSANCRIDVGRAGRDCCRERLIKFSATAQGYCTAASGNL